jgi:hypothetical protein
MTWKQPVEQMRAAVEMVQSPGDREWQNPVPDCHWSFLSSPFLVTPRFFRQTMSSSDSVPQEQGNKYPVEKAKQAQTTTSIREAAELIHTEVRPVPLISPVVYLISLALIRLYVAALVQKLSRLKQTERGGKGDRTERGCPKASLLAPLYATICTAVLGLENCSFEKGGVEAPVMYAVSSHVDATLLNSFFLS